VGLAGIALVQAIGLPALEAQGGRFVVLSLAAMAACLATGVALAAAGRWVWRIVAALAVVVLAGWALPRVVAVPGLVVTGDLGAVSAALAVACLAAAGLAVRPGRPPARALATALAVVAVFGPGAWVALVALGPGVVGGERSLAAGPVHGRAHSAYGEESIEFRPGSGRQGGRYVIAVPAPARRTAGELVLVVVAALAFSFGAVRHLGRRRLA
jgi:hypothetical protein